MTFFIVIWHKENFLLELGWTKQNNIYIYVYIDTYILSIIDKYICT